MKTFGLSSLCLILLQQQLYEVPEFSIFPILNVLSLYIKTINDFQHTHPLLQLYFANHIQLQSRYSLSNVLFLAFYALFLDHKSLERFPKSALMLRLNAPNNKNNNNNSCYKLLSEVFNLFGSALFLFSEQVVEIYRTMAINKRQFN